MAYRPSAHVRQYPEPSKLIWPGPHVEQVLAPPSEYWPAKHQSHTEDLPVRLDAVPGMHWIQSESSVSEHREQPDDSLNLPAPHSRQALVPPNEYWPAGHRLQSVLLFLSLNEPISQSVQAVVPLADEKDPGVQDRQALLCNPLLYVPAWHVRHTVDCAIE